MVQRPLSPCYTTVNAEGSPSGTLSGDLCRHRMGLHSNARVSVRVRVMARVRWGGVKSKEIDRTWMCDNMETRDAAPRVCPRSRETEDSALSGV